MTLSKHSTISKASRTNSALVADQKANAALVYDYDGRYISGATTSRTTDLIVRDHEGILRTFGSGEVAIEGGRVVENLAASTDSPSTQSITVVSGSEYQVRIGADSASGATAVCSGAFTGTLTGDGASAQSFDAAKTASTTTLTITITGAVTDLQVENVTGQSNQNPSEYVSSDVGKQVYATENGNTVTDNVVTEGTGPALSPAPAVYCEPEHTNLITYSEEFDNGAWVKADSTINANATTAPDGTLTADRLIDDSSTGTGQARTYENTVTVSSGTSVFSVFVKADQLSFVCLETSSFDAGGNAKTWFNLSTGAVGTANHDDSGIEAFANDWYRCWVQFTTTTDLTGELVIRVCDADNDVVVDLDGTSSIFIWGAQCELSPTPTSYVPTSGSTATANATEPVVPWPSGLSSNFAIKFDWTPDEAGQGTIWLLGNYTDTNDAFGVLHDTTNLIFRNRLSGSNNDTTKALTYAAGTVYTVHCRHSTANGLDIWIDDVKGTNDTTTTDVAATSTLSLGQDGNGASQQIGSISNLKIYKVSPNISDAEVLRIDGAPWEPSMLFGNSENGGFYDLSNASNLLDAPAGSPSSVDGVVGQISDISGNDLHLTQSTAGYKGLRRSGGYVELDKVDDNYQFTVPGGGITGSMVFATTDGVIFAECDLTAAATWDMASGGKYFPGTEVIGVVVIDRVLTQIEKGNVRRYFVARGAGDNNFSTVTNMLQWFRGRVEMTALDVSNWTTTSVSNFGYFADGCTNLTSLDVSGWTTTSVTNFGHFVYGCTNLTSLDVSGWTTTSVTNFFAFAYNCTNLTSLDVSGWTTTSVTNFGHFVYGCTNLTSLDVSGWTTTSVSNFGYFADGCTNLTSLDVSNWNTSSVAAFNHFVYGCSSLTSLDVSGWDTSSVSNFYAFAYNCTNLTALTHGTAFAASPCTAYTAAFLNCALPEANVNSILIDIDNAATSSGTLHINGGTNAAPTGAGATAVTNLQGRSWTVTTA